MSLTLIVSFGIFLSNALQAQVVTDPPTVLSIYQSKDESLQASQQEADYVQNFPDDEYDIYALPNAGSYYLDRKPDVIKDQLKQGELWERKTVRLIRKVVQAGSVAIDLGAHIGTHTQVMSRCVGSAGSVVAFEPQMKIFREHVMNLKLNGIHNVLLYRCAVGDKNGVIQMSEPSLGNEGGTSIGAGGDYAYLMPLDDLGLTNVSFIKIDVENHELEALEGARKTIAMNHPIILVEIFGNANHLPQDKEKGFSQTIDFFTEMGYHVRKFHCDDYLAIPNFR